MVWGQQTDFTSVIPSDHHHHRQWHHGHKGASPATVKECNRTPTLNYNWNWWWFWKRCSRSGGTNPTATKPKGECLLLVLTVGVVAVHVPLLTFVQPVAIVDDADLAEPTVGPSFDNRVAHTPWTKPSGCTDMKTCTRAEINIFRFLNNTVSRCIWLQ